MKKRIFSYAIILIGIFLFYQKETAYAAGPTEIQSNITTPTVWNKEGSPYIVLNTIYATAPLTIEPGTIVKFKNTGLSLVAQNTFTAIGTPSEKIIFTSVCDSSYGGDTQNYGYPYCYQGILRGQWGGISIYDTVNTVKIKHAKILYAGRGLSYQTYNTNVAYQGLVSIENTEIRYSRSGIYLRNAIPWMRSLVLSDNDIGLEITTSLSNRVPKISNSSIVNNGIGIRAVLSGIRGSMPVDASYSWWGDVSGPYFYHSDLQKANLQGQGNKIIGDGVVFRPWLESEPIFDDISCVDDCYSNVLFLPGLEASRLYDDSESSCIADKIDPTRAWEPSCNDDARKLYLDAAGKSLDTDIHTKEGDVLDETPVGANIYKSFIAQMDTMKDTDHLINDWKPVAYDWRLSFDDILNDGTIVETLRNLAQNSKTNKVTIVAHSNGGLLTKALLQKLGDEEVKNLVDKIIFVAVPQVGTPSAIAGMLHGYKQNLFPVLDTETARGLAENMPGAYQLLPSEKYFSSVETPAVTFDTANSPDWKDRYSDPIRSQNRLRDFLADTYRRVAATDSDTDTPSKLNEGLLNTAEDSHDTLDSWMIPDGVKVMQIAGWGVPATLSSIEYDTRKFCDASTCSSSVDLLNPNFNFTLDGDGTVVTPSAVWMSGAERYWLDIGKWNNNHPLTTFGLSMLEREHKDILEIPELNTFITDSIINNTKPIANYGYLSTDVPSADNKKRLQYSLHSPLTLDLYDDEGRHTGVTSDGNIEERIPGTYYRQFGDVKYIFADESSPLYISLSGYDTGTFTFAVKEFEGDTPLGTVTFRDMPTTPQTEVTFDISSDLENASDLHIDKDGDGTVDFRLQPKIGEVVTFDGTPPTTTASLSGMQGTNDWYTSDATAMLSATDNENGSGVEKTEYSLDNGVTWNLYAEPLVISQEGTAAIQYFSTDNQGNKEGTKIETIKIDKTAPEANIAFNPSTQKLDITGMDNLSQDVSVATTESSVIPAPEPGSNKIKSWFSDRFHKEKNKKIIVTAILIDEAGHKTDIVFEKKKDKERRIDLSLQSVSYDGEKTMLSKTLLQYKWRLDRKSQYCLFASQLRTDSTDIEAHYIPKKNETWIMERPRELADDDNDDDSEHRLIRTKLSGMVIPSMMTEKGMMRIIY